MEALQSSSMQVRVCEVCLTAEAQELSFFCADCEAWIEEISVIVKDNEIEVLSPFEEVLA